MTKNQQTLTDLLEVQGHTVKSVQFYPYWGFQGWFADVTEKDEDGDEFEVTYRLGGDIIEAKGQIQNNEIIRLDD